MLQDNMSAFCVETQDRTMVFAALKDDCVDWVEKLCHSAFQVRRKRKTKNCPEFIIVFKLVGLFGVGVTDPGADVSFFSFICQRGDTLGSQPPHMEENQIYASADQGNSSAPVQM